MLNENETTFYYYSLSIAILEYNNFNDIRIVAPSTLQSLNSTIDMHTASAYTHAYMVILLMQI
jgi:hypothetical protein